MKFLKILDKLKFPSFFQFYVALFLFFTIQRVVVFFCGEAYLYDFKSRGSDLFIGALHDFSWCFLVLVLAEALDQFLVIIGLRTKNLMKWLFSLLSLVLMFFLDHYFLSTNSLLSNMILLFNLDQLLDLLAFKENMSVVRTMWLFLLLVSFVIFNRWALRKLILEKISKWLLLGLSIFSFSWVVADESDFPNIYATNKSFYFFRSLANYQAELHQAGDVRFEDFRELDPLFLGKEKLEKHNLLRKKWEENSQLGHFLKKTSNGKPPNICIIIVESLSSSLVGQYAQRTGNVMPFLDSLSRESIYFPNTLSTAQRTHHVLPAVFASLPHSKDHTCFQEEEYPDHVGITKLTKSSHFSSFYCGVGLDFGQMDRFMRINEVDYKSNRYTGISQKEKNEIKDFWGLPDKMMFREYFKESDLRRRKGYYSDKSALDVLLTISSHEPFNYPDKEKHSKIVLDCLNRSSKSKFKSYLKTKIPELASFNYTDESLKYFFERIKETDDFKNTIFIITGDHGSTLLYEHEMSKYHVPLMIYSPLLKKARKVPHIISHLDIAPTLMNYLRKVYDLKIPDWNYFLGNEINFNNQNKRALIFKGVNLITKDLVYNQLAYLDGKLFRLTNQLVPVPYNHKTWHKKLMSQSKLMCLFNHYVVEQNHLLPNIYPRIEQFQSRSIEKKDCKSEYLSLFEMDLKKWKGKDILIDLSFSVDTSISYTLPALPVWIKVKSAKSSSEYVYEKLMYGRYVSRIRKHPHKATVHFYISKEEIDELDANRQLICFLHNVNKEKMPFDEVKWSIQ